MSRSGRRQRGGGSGKNSRLHVLVRRSKERAVARLDHVFAPVTLKLALGMLGSGKYGWTRYAPPKPRLPGRRRGGGWKHFDRSIPDSLRTQPGTLRYAAEEDRAYAEGPLHDFAKVHMEASLYIIRHSWTWLIPPYPRLRRALRTNQRARELEIASRPDDIAPEELARLIEAKARELGLSAVGFAKADRRYTFAQYGDPGDATIIVCVLEQDHAATQTAPSSRAERAAFTAYGDLQSLVSQLVIYLKGLGYAARPNDWGGQEALAIFYAEQAGLGQMGLNGQLLTPQAGSRVRLALITTEAPVALGASVDLGVPKICDACQLCVRRCPPGAIPVQRREKRGVVKAAIKPERCFPVVAQAHGCAVCMKVCPVQRYGLAAVLDRFEQDGTILGKGTDELEGYNWPLDGRHYGPGQKPRITEQVMAPPGWVFDKSRTAPVIGSWRESEGR